MYRNTKQSKYPVQKERKVLRVNGKKGVSLETTLSRDIREIRRETQRKTYMSMGTPWVGVCTPWRALTYAWACETNSVVGSMVPGPAYLII